MGLVFLLALASLFTLRAASGFGAEGFSYLYALANHPRCMNCHGAVQNGEHVPTVGDQLKIHPMHVSSAIENLGHKCTGCHQTQNQDSPKPPGASNDLMPGFFWHMPEQKMMLRTADNKRLSQRALCELWTDPKRNNNRGSLGNLDKLEKKFIEHFRKDPLIHWSFSPGEGRAAAPGGVEQLVEATKAWVAWLKDGRTCADL